MVQKIGRGGNEGGNEGGEGKGRKRRKRKRRRRKRTKKRMKRRTKRTKRRGERRGGEGGGGSLSKISSEETLSKLRLKLNQNKAKSTKHAGRPADYTSLSKNFVVTNINSLINLAMVSDRGFETRTSKICTYST